MESKLAVKHQRRKNAGLCGMIFRNRLSVTAQCAQSVDGDRSSPKWIIEYSYRQRECGTQLRFGATCDFQLTLCGMYEPLLSMQLTAIIQGGHKCIRDLAPAQACPATVSADDQSVTAVEARSSQSTVWFASCWFGGGGGLCSVQPSATWSTAGA